MGFWEKLYYGLKVALGIATKLQAKGVIEVKELPKVEAVVKAIEEAVQERLR